MGIKISKWQSNLIRAESDADIILKNYIVNPALTAEFEYEKDSPVIYKGLGFGLRIPKSTYNSIFSGYDFGKSFEFLSLSSISLLEYNSLDTFVRELSADFAYPEKGRGILLTPEELHAIYFPLLKEINTYINFQLNHK